MSKFNKNINEQFKTLLSKIIKEEIDLAFEQEAIDDIYNWMSIENPHGVTKDNFFSFVKDSLIKNYGRETAMQAFNKLYKDKGCLSIKKTENGKEVFVWEKEKCNLN